MPTNVTAGNNTAITSRAGEGGLNTNALPTTPAVVAKTPGFDPAGAPLGDADVWNLFIGSGSSRRAVNTAAMATKQSIDGIEAKKLLALAQKDPKEFALRLLADSSNGTPVEFKFSKLMKGFGIARIDFKCENGHMTTKASLEVFNKAADGFLGQYMAKDAREKGQRSTLTLEVQGDLNAKAGIDNISATISAGGLPALSAEKLMELDRVKGDIKSALEGEGTPAEKTERVQSLVRDALKKMSEIPVGFFVELIRDRHSLELDVKEKDHSLRAHAETGNGNYALTFTDLLDSKDGAEADLGARIAGSVGEDRDTIKVGDVAVFTTDKLAIELGEDNRPILSKVGADGTKTKVDDHLGEILMYLPLALQFANRGGIG